MDGGRHFPVPIIVLLSSHSIARQVLVRISNYKENLPCHLKASTNTNLTLYEGRQTTKRSSPVFGPLLALLDGYAS